MSSQRRHPGGSLRRPQLSINDNDDDDNYSQTSQTSSHSSQSDTDLLQGQDLQSSVDPFQSAISELESLVIAHLNSFKEHPGIKTNPHSTDNVHKELELLLRPILEIAAHSGPAQARAHYWKSSSSSAVSSSVGGAAKDATAGGGDGGVEGVSSSSSHRTIDEAIEHVHNVLNLELIFPVLLETAQSDASPNKRAAALSFFHNLFMEYKLPGSYLDYVENPNLIRYSGTLYGPFEKIQKHAPPSRMVLKQRTMNKANKSQKLLRYWIEASSFCILPGAFTSMEKDDKIASRAVISSSAVLRPALNHVKDKIKSADDAGALRLFLPVMKMIAGVLQRLFVVAASDTASSQHVGGGGGDALRSACVKFLEIVVLCFSSREQPAEGHRKGMSRSNVAKEEDFALENLPVGHPIITRQALEEVGEDAFTVLRGLAMMGGQVKVDSGVKSDVRMSLGLDSYGQGPTPTLQIVGILRPAALSYLELESTMNQQVSEENPFPTLNRSEIEMDFQLNQKSYALTINAISMLATNRPTFFADSSSCLAKRAMDPPTVENSLFHMSKAAIMTVNSHLRASCLTLLRNSLSVTTGASDILFKALASEECGMKIQAEKALRMATQAASLKTAGRAARNRAAVFYEWEGTALGGGGEMDTLGSKRKRAGEDKLEQMRAAKAARGLGNGIQLPKNMVDACELILLNLGNLPPSRAAVTVGDKKKAKVQSDGKRKRLFTLDFLIDAIITNGESLISNENKWYGRDGGDAWVMDISALVSDDEGEEDDEIMTLKTTNKKKAPVPVSFTLDTKIMDAALAATEGNSGDHVETYKEQCKVAAADAVERILSRSRSVRDPSIADFGNQIAAKMAWSLQKLKPHNELKTAADMALEAVSSTAKKLGQNNMETGILEKLPTFFDEFPLVPSFIQYDINNSSADNVESIESDKAQDKPALSLTQRLLNEAILACGDDKEAESRNLEKFENTLHLYITSVLHACEMADEKPLDTQRKKLATMVSSSLSKDISMIPVVTEHSLELLSVLCDVDGITKKVTEISRKTTNQNLATVAATNAAKASAERRAKAALLALRDAAFQRSKASVRKYAVNCAVGLAAGRLPSSLSVEDMALKLVMNVLYPKSPDLANHVVAAATNELERASNFACEVNDSIRKSNEEALLKKPELISNPLQPLSDIEKNALDSVRKPANLFMALCIRQPEMIKDLMKFSCKEGADVLAKAVRNNMPKLSRAAAKKYGAAKIALQVAELADFTETAILLSFLDNLAPAAGNAPGQDLIDACLKIQDERICDGHKDPRFLIPILSGMQRRALESRLPELVNAEDNVFMAALHRMSERLKRQIYSFREESEEAPLVGMTLCEQLVYLHKLDFASANMPQKRYLQAIALCLENDEVYTDRVIMAALDHISGTFLHGEPLPLAYMRTVILTCSKHESLHSWICNVLLPRLVEGQVYNDRRQWEGWMRCAQKLEMGDSGVSSIEAIKQLPPEQYQNYRQKYPQKDKVGK